jgi:hypothetical protein
MSAQHIAPTIDDIPHGFTEADGVHEQTWEEKHQADDFTVRARKKVSALMAAFNSFWHVAGFDDICKEAGIDAGELRRMYMTILELAMRAEDHAERDGHAPARVRRFHCPDYAAELCYRREFLRGDTEAEKTKQRASHSRAWRERWRRTIHAAQCRNHLPIVERQSGGIFGKRKVATIYTDRLADVLAMTGKNADKHRGRVARYTRAAQASLELLRQTADPYAPDFDYNPKPKPSTPTLDESETEAQEIADPPYIVALRRAVKLAKKGMACAPPEEIAARRTEMHEWINALMPDAGEAEENAHPHLCAVERNVDAPKNESAPPAEVVTKTTFSESENSDFPAESGDLPEKKGDVQTPLFSGVEYDPEPEPRGINLAEATAAADACASVGVEHVLVVWTDETLPVGKNCVGTDEFKSIAEFQENLPCLLARNERSPVESMAVRVRWKGETHLLQVDECALELLERLAPFSFMQIATSQGNGQAWLAFSEALTQEQYDELKLRLFTRLNPTKSKEGANGGAHGSVRWPGSLNRKPKRRYADGESPRVQLLSVQPGRKVSIAELDAAGLLAPALPKKTSEQIREIKGRLPQGWPSMDEYLAKHKDRSTAEFAWCCRAIEAGWPQYKVEEELARRGAKARTRTCDNYITETVSNAARKVGVAA